MAASLGTGTSRRTETANQLVSPAAGGPPAVGGSSGDSGSGVVEFSKFISFAIGDDQYGVDIMAVREIKGWSQITSLPRQPDYMRGVLNLRGVMLPIIDLRCRFGQTEASDGLEFTSNCVRAD